jgi:ArsR family transcriptional regulator
MVKIDTEKMAKVFKALSNPIRLELYLQIVKKHEAVIKQPLAVYSAK